MGQDVSVTVGDATMEIYVAEPEGDARGAVIVLQEAFGVNDHIRDSATGSPPPATWRRHPPLPPQRRSRARLRRHAEVMPYIMQLQADQIEADLEATFAHLKDLGFEGAGRHRRVLHGRQHLVRRRLLLGARCRSLASTAAASPRAASASRRCSTSPRRCKTPWLGLFGDQDGSIPTNEVEGLRDGAGEGGARRPRSSATPRRTTASTATPAARTTRRRPRTAGTARSPGSISTSPDRRRGRSTGAGTPGAGRSSGEGSLGR